MMLTKHELLWTLLLAGAVCYPWQARAECRTVGEPAMTLYYDYQRDRAAGSPDPIARVNFDTELRCDAPSEAQQLQLDLAGRGYSSVPTPNIGEVNMLADSKNSVGFVWHNRVNGREQRVVAGGAPLTRSLSADGETIRIHDAFHFYYLSGLLQPGFDISPSPIQVSYLGKAGKVPLYELNFPAIPLFARSCSIKTPRMDVDFDKVEQNLIQGSEQEPLPAVVRQLSLELDCDPGTNVDFRVTATKQQFGHTLLNSETLDTSAKGVGVKMRYASSNFRSNQEIRFGETLRWGRTPELGYAAVQRVSIPFEFYLVKTESEVVPGRLEANANIEIRHE